MHRELWGQRQSLRKIFRTATVEKDDFTELQSILGALNHQRNSDEYVSKDVLAAKVEFLHTKSTDDDPELLVGGLVHRPASCPGQPHLLMLWTLHVPASPQLLMLWTKTVLWAMMTLWTMTKMTTTTLPWSLIKLIFQTKPRRFSPYLSICGPDCPPVQEEASRAAVDPLPKRMGYHDRHL